MVTAQRSLWWVSAQTCSEIWEHCDVSGEPRGFSEGFCQGSGTVLSVGQRVSVNVSFLCGLSVLFLSVFVRNTCVNAQFFHLDWGTITIHNDVMVLLNILVCSHIHWSKIFEENIEKTLPLVFFSFSPASFCLPRQPLAALFPSAITVSYLITWSDGVIGNSICLAARGSAL